MCCYALWSYTSVLPYPSFRQMLHIYIFWVDSEDGGNIHLYVCIWLQNYASSHSKESQFDFFLSRLNSITITCNIINIPYEISNYVSGNILCNASVKNQHVRASDSYLGYYEQATPIPIDLYYLAAPICWDSNNEWFFRRLRLCPSLTSP